MYYDRSRLARNMTQMRAERNTDQAELGSVIYMCKECNCWVHLHETDEQDQQCRSCTAIAAGVQKARMKYELEQQKQTSEIDSSSMADSN